MAAIVASRHPQRLLVAFVVAGLAFGLFAGTLVGRRGLGVVGELAWAIAFGPSGASPLLALSRLPGSQRSDRALATCVVVRMPRGSG
jgi:hypothetical protein